MNTHARYPDSLPPGGRTPAERLVEAGNWLLKAAPSPTQAETEWMEDEAAWLRPGWHFAAVEIQLELVHAATEREGPQDCAAPLIEALGGPVIYNPRGMGGGATYTALVPASVHGRWDVAGTWLYPVTTMLLVPSPGRLFPTDEGPWWVSPLTQAGLLCNPVRVAAFAGIGRERQAARVLRGRGDA